ncbi:uncharacterized protein FOMMEDRAFT_78728 [Fomitiporia mediterranea MF3/22]|uniref:uncharacterized protein n=1 Tax=Fomitiporia mediterranea (strain MF3/22) TaxID=694068 RepID=UPI00044092D6|nr:uncharacterized protein FOMMEDRAFT_78728 [Fomitiporia mediterranea MF3/22]EJD05318.1 hypothetical protein FOMMEDRAFT_78728 [Fomitiporia mediterranea MF3/22]
MPDLPIDTSNPAVRDFLMLTRLQVLTPLSLLINIAAVCVCTFTLSPSLGEIARMYPTSLTPKPSLIGTYIAAVYIMQIGYCIILVLARKTETKQALIKGTGISLVLANWVLGFWAIAWSLKAFIISSILLGILIILLLYSNIVLNVYHPIALARPLDAAFIHAPIRLFLILPLTVLFPISLFIAVGHYWEQGDTKAYNSYAWEGFGVFFVLNVLGAFFIAWRRDIVWTVGAAWLALSVWQETPKSAPVSVCVLRI